MTTVFIISAPSGSGKSTLVSRLLNEVERLTFSVSYTTRKPRGSEVPGEAYHFIERAEFERRLAADEFLESRRGFRQLLRHASGRADDRRKRTAKTWCSTLTCRVRHN